MTRKLRQPRVLHQAMSGAFLVACLLLQGCGRSNPEPPPDILKAQREALEKAKGLGKMEQDAVQRRDAEMEAQQK
jgi:hypothetical protein